jgi:transketolase
MRAAFVAALSKLAEINNRVVLLTGDLGYMALEPFSERFPKRFFNVGVAEQNMVGLATGLAESGFIPFVYSIVPFITLRPYEFIRNGPVQHNFPVRFVGIGGGFEYATNGMSHYGLEDVGVMRMQPGLTVITPGDHEQAGAAILATRDLPGPIYFRLGKDDKAVIAGLNGCFQLGRAQVLCQGEDLLIVVMGSLANEALRAAQILLGHGVSSRVVLVSTFNPAPVEDLAEALADFRTVLTMENHYALGGIGSLVCEIVAERGLSTRVVRCSIGACYDGVTGSQQFLYERHGISAERVAERALISLRDTTRCHATI